MDDIITGARGASTGQISEMEAVYRVHLESEGEDGKQRNERSHRMAVI